MASETKAAEIFESVKQWGRWGADDERGALNLLTADRVKAAAALVKTGRTVSCAHDLATVPSVEDHSPAQHMMLMAGDAPEASGVDGYAQSTDYLGMACHGMGVSHIDALCHVFVDDQMYNGFAASDVKSTGAMKNSIASAKGGIVGRGVLLDIPRLRGVDWIEPPDTIGPDELAGAVAAQGSAGRLGRHPDRGHRPGRAPGRPRTVDPVRPGPGRPPPRLHPLVEGSRHLRARQRRHLRPAPARMSSTAGPFPSTSAASPGWASISSTISTCSG